MSPTTSSEMKLITRALHEGLRVEIEKAAEAALQTAKQQLESRLTEIVSNVSLRVFEHISMQDFNNRLVIEVKTDFKNEPEQ